MALELSTAGITVSYAFEATAGGGRPTGTGVKYTMIPGVKSIPEFGTDVNTLQTTSLDVTKNHTYILGLQDPGGAIGLTVNDYTAFRVAWNAMLTSYRTNKAAGKAMWVQYSIPGLKASTETSAKDQSFFFIAEPSELGFGGAEVDAVYENIANLVPSGEYVWAEAVELDS